MVEAASAFGLRLSAYQIGLFVRYSELLVEWNSRFNLTAVSDPAGIAIRHIADSLSLALVWQPAGPAQIVEVGSGAGMPGLALSILWPECQLALVESVAKKARFLDAVVRDLNLSGVVVIRERAETAAHFPKLREQADLVVARALAMLPALVELTLPFCKVGGTVVAYKSGDLTAEILSAQAAITELGGEGPHFTPVLYPALAGHALLVVRKVWPTPDRYPRAPGIPAKRPLS